MTDWLKARIGRMRVSTLALIIAFIALFWVSQAFHPAPKPPAPSVVPPGFVPDPNYTWVPRTSVREGPTTTKPTPTTTTTPTSPTSPSQTTETTSPTSPTSTTSPTTTTTPLPAPAIPGPTPPPPGR